MNAKICLVVLSATGFITAGALASPEKIDPAPVETPRPTNAAEARSAFALQAKTLDYFKGNPKDWRDRLERGEKWSARRIPFARAIDRIEDTLTEKEKETAFLHGLVDDLRRDDDCWAIEDYGSYKDAIIAYLEAETGKLVLVWRPPEG